MKKSEFTLFLIDKYHISGKKKSSPKEIYNRTTNGGCCKAQAPQGTPLRASQQIPQRTPNLSKAEELDENIYSEVQEEETLSLDLTKTGMVCFYLPQNHKI